MKRIEGRYDSYDKDEISSLNMTRSLSPVEILNCRNKELTEILYHEIEESNAKIVALGFNKISKISYLPEKILKLELKSNLISKIQNLENCVFLQVLDLSNNRISRIENLSNNFYLQELNLGNNHIKKIENLEMLKELKRLNMENNLLSSTSSIRTLSLNTKLMVLVLKGNPISIQGKYKPTIASLLPKLVILDYFRIVSQGFKKHEQNFTFFSKPFLDCDQNVKDQLEVIPTIRVKSEKKNRKDSVQISTETQTFHPNSSNHADAEVQTFLDEQYRDSFNKNTVSIKDLKLPSFKSSNSAEMGRIRRFYKAVNVFKDIPSTFIETLINSSEFTIGQESEVIFHAESIVEKLIVIIKGTIQYLNKLYTYGNYLFAESLIMPEEVKSDVICIENTEYFILTKKEITKLFRLYPNYRELIMKNYLEKNITFADFEIKLKKKPETLKKKEKEKSKSLAKLNLKSLISSRTSKDLGLSCLETVPIVENKISTKVQKDIEKLLQIADPFDLNLSDEVKTSFEDSKFFELSEKVEKLYSVYQKDIQLNKSRLKIEEEAKNFLKNGFKSDVELIAMERESFKKAINACNIEEEGENL